MAQGGTSVLTIAAVVSLAADLMGAALIPASPEAWAPYPLYTTELTPVISHAAFTYPAATAATAATLHTQVSLPGGEAGRGRMKALSWPGLISIQPRATWGPRAAAELLSGMTVPLGFGI